MYTEDYKTLLNEIKENLNKWQNIPYSWVRRFKRVKITVIPKEISIFIAIANKIPVGFFFSQKLQEHPTMHIEMQRTKNIQNNLEKQ